MIRFYKNFIGYKHLIDNKFRSDIQSLRALAVLVVILYHFQVSFFKGGFVGVDIFFVISGYLISKSIINNAENNNFNFINFYFGRVKRLYPAFLVTILITYILGFFVFSPVDFEALSATVIFSSVGLSNIYFWLTSDYFDNFSTLKPLLHTWSLSVEFQFYLIWPLILLFMVYLRRLYLVFLLSITLISGYISYKYLAHDATGTFFLTPFRIHEFAFGALIFLIERRLILKEKLNNIIYILGIFLVFFAIFKFNSTMAFPGSIVWIPVIGTSLMIYAGGNISFSKLVHLKPIEYIGEISYSLYLVHWPIFVFFVYTFPEIVLDYKVKLILIFITFIFSIFLYTFVEKPFRKNVFGVGRGGYVIVCQSFVILIVLIGASSFIGKGWIWRLPQELRDANNINIDEMHAYTWENQKKYAVKNKFNLDGKEKILIIGDSQSADLINLLIESGHDKQFDIVARTIYTECNIPYLSEPDKNEYYKKINNMTISKPDIIPICNEQINSVMNEKILFEQADRIFIAFNWNDFTVPYMDKSLDKVNEIASSNKKVWIFGRKDLSKSSIELFNIYNSKKYATLENIDEFAAKFKKTQNSSIEKLLKSRESTTYIDMYNLICKSKNECSVLTEDKKIILYDSAHFSPDGAKFLGSRFYQMIK